MNRIEQLEFAAKIINDMINYMRTNPSESNEQLMNKKIAELRQVNIDIILSDDEDENTKQ